jgi:pyrroline-5-carboxylate reductase
MNLKTKTIAFLGAGNMGEALIRGLLKAQLVPPQQIVAVDVRPDRLEQLHRELGVRTAAELPAADVVVLAVKPQQLSTAVSSARSTPATLYVSIAAGVTTNRIEVMLGNKARVVRAMPNTPALVGAGAAGLCRGTHATDEDLAVAEMILGAVGVAVRVDEKLLDAVTALSGSGPAYVFYVTEALIKGGIEAGLSRELARQLALQTVAGAAKLMTESGEAPAELRRKVTSPGGTTEAALKVMADRKLTEILVEAMQAAARRSRELAGDSK